VFKFITARPLWVNILVALGLVFLVIILFFSSLDWITHHDKNEKVPNVTGQNVVAATKMLEAKGFRVEVQDSVFIDTLARQAVVKQAPAGDGLVKAGRTIYLTINRSLAPQVEMPNLVGYSFKSAQLLLQSLKLKMGDTSYRPDIAPNSVLEQLYNGTQIKPGTKIPMGSTISFVLGSGLGNSDMNVPDLVGMTLEQARQYISTLHINLGAVVPRGVISDSLHAFVVDQEPAVYMQPVPGQKVASKMKPGQIMTIYISATAPVKDTTTVAPNNP